MRMDEGIQGVMFGLCFLFGESVFAPPIFSLRVIGLESGVRHNIHSRQMRPVHEYIGHTWGVLRHISMLALAMASIEQKYLTIFLRLDQMIRIIFFTGRDRKSYLQFRHAFPLACREAGSYLMTCSLAMVALIRRSVLLLAWHLYALYI